jgi:hypothetical protein
LGELRRWQPGPRIGADHIRVRRDDADAASAVLFGYRAGGGSAEVRDISTFSMSFAVQANLVEFYARRALEGTGTDRARAVWRLESMLPKLLTIQRAERILALCD